MQSKKRKTSPSAAAAQRGMWAQMKFSGAQPWSDYGAMRVQRGTAANVERFGATARTASALQKERRKMTGYTGRGKYGMKTLGKIYKAATSKPFVKGFKRGVGAGADMLTALTPLQPELAPFAAAAEGVSGMIGRGMYGPTRPRGFSTNELIAGSANKSPQFTSVADETGSMIVTHRERVADIVAPSSSGFVTQEFDINPGLEGFAAWLHQVASSYEEYEMIQCVYEYKGHDLIGIQNSLDLQGQVIAATQYNVKLPAFTDRHEMASYPHANVCSLNSDLIHGVECDPEKISGDGHRLVRVGGMSKDEDIRDYDHAKFHLGINNTPSDLFNKEIGQLFVNYTVKLIKPKIFGGRGKALSTYKQFCKDGGVTLPFGDSKSAGDTATLVASKNTLPMKYIQDPSPTSADPSIHYWEFPQWACGVFKVTALVSGVQMEDASVDLQVNTADLQGNVSLVRNLYPIYGTNATTTIGDVQYLEDGASGSRTLLTTSFCVDVRPYSGAGSNRFGIRTNLTGDTVAQTSIVIEEINTLGNEVGVPEVKKVLDGLVVALEG